MESKVCKNCKFDKDVEDFGYDSRSRDGLKSQCKVCRNTTSKTYRENHQPAIKNSVGNRLVHNKRNLIAYLVEHPCVDCNESDVAVLEFDHVRGNKSHDVSRMMSRYTWDLIEQEIEKCDVRCANCHRKKTLHERGIQKSDTILLQ